MKEKLFALFFLVHFFVPSYSQGWELNIKSTGDEGLYDAIEDINGNYLLCGHIGNGPYAQYYCDGYLVKVSPTGTVLMDKRISVAGGYLKFGKLIEQTDGYLVFGSMYPDSNSTYRDIAIFKFDFNLNEQWRKTCGSIYWNEVLLNAIIDNHDNIIAIGSGGDSNGGVILFYRLNSLGDSLHSQYYQYAPPFDSGFDILPSDSGFKAFAWPGLSGLLANKILNLDSNFSVKSIMNVDTFPTSPYFPLNPNAWYVSTKAKWLNDSVYIACARVKNPEYASQDADKSKGIGVLWFTKNDSILQSRVFGKPDTGDAENERGMDFIYNSHIYAGCTANYDWNTSFPAFTSQLTWYNLNRFDESGNVAWQKYYGGDANYHLFKVFATRDSGCLMVGTRFEQGVNVGNERDIYIIKVGPSGNYLPVNVEENFSEPECTIYPNPTSGIFTIQIPNNNKQEAVIEIYNVMGEKLFSIPNTDLQMLKIDLSAQPKGIYFIRANLGESFYSGKVVIQ